MSYIGTGIGTGQPSSGTVTTDSLSDTFVLPVEKGGTETITLTGIVKGNGTGAMTVATPGTDYEAPLPDVTGNDGKFLTLASGVKTWVSVPAPVGSIVYMAQTFGAL